MADLLIRNITDEDKRALASRAAKNRRSQQAEALSILKNGLREKQNSWVSILRSAAESIGGAGLELPTRHPLRPVDISEWL